jgi:hypothetical protein
VGVEFMPSMVPPKGFQAEEGFVALGGPELAGAFKPALVLAAGRFHGSRTQGLVGQLELFSGRAVVTPQSESAPGRPLPGRGRACARRPHRPVRERFAHTVRQ